jgi:serine/threonine protein kinase
MARLRLLFRCIGEAVCANGLKALAGLVPMGGVIYDVAEDACQRLREAQQEDQIHVLVEAAAAASPSEVKAEAEAVAQEVAGDQPEAVRHGLAAYLAGVPAAIRQSLRRPADPAGLSVPITFALKRAEDLLQFLPRRPPRFAPGDRPAGLGDWELVELLGVGGFGEVWKARHVHFDGIAPVALKFCLDRAARDRLLRHEATVLNQVMRQGRHPGIVPLLDASLSADPPCLKYEYIEGGDLAGLVREWQERPPRPRWRAATEVVARLARIVAFAHKLSPPIVHRDLKPANILVRKAEVRSQKDESRQKTADSGSSDSSFILHPSDFDLRITDFGIGGVAALQALAEAQQGSTGRGELLGTTLRGSHTPLYASPQQMRGEAPDPRDDVHALGVIWYQLLTGDLQSGPPTGLWAEELEEQGMSRDLVRVLGACVAGKAERRPADAGVLVEQLDRLVSPAAAPPPAPAPKRETPPRPVVHPPEPPPVTREDRLAAFLHAGQTGALSWLLDLTNRRIGDAGAIALAGCVRLANLSTLILSGCDIGDEGLVALAGSPHIMNLTRLDLWDNRISDRGLEALAGCRYLENLQFLDLGRNRIGDEGVKALAASPYFARLGELLLVSNHIGDEGALALAASPYLANLAWLKPLDNRITEKGVDALKKAFGRRVRIM